MNLFPIVVYLKAEYHPSEQLAVETPQPFYLDMQV